MFFKKKEEEERKRKLRELFLQQQTEINRLKPFENAYFVTDRNLQATREQYNKLYKLYQALRNRLLEIYKEHPELAPKKEKVTTDKQQNNFDLQGYLDDLVENTSIDDDEKNA